MQICILFWSSPPDSSPGSSCCVASAETWPNALRTLVQECRGVGMGGVGHAVQAKASDLQISALTNSSPWIEQIQAHCSPVSIENRMLVRRRDVPVSMALNREGNPRREVVHQHTFTRERHRTGNRIAGSVFRESVS